MATPCKSCFLTVDNEVGKLAEVTAKLKEAGLNILAICAWTEGDTGKLIACTDDNEKACEVFKTFGECGWKEGICVEADNAPGALHAIAKRTSFGEQLRHQSWISYEYNTLQALAAAGADVPRPYAMANNAILMDYIGDLSEAAPALNEISLDKTEACLLFERLLVMSRRKKD